MHATVNSPARWLKYLLYLGIISELNYLLGNSMLGGLSRWLDYGIRAAALYLMFRLAESNSRYKNVLIFSGAALVINMLGIPFLALVASLCAIAAQYQEYRAHGELIVNRDPELAGKWNRLFWIQFAVEMIAGLLISLVVAVMAAEGGLESAPIVAIATVISAVLSVALKVMYLVYLNRTVKGLED